MAERIVLPTERLVYSAVGQRPRLVLPDGSRLVVWVIVNVEEWDPRETMPRTVITLPAARRCRTSQIGLGTNTATGSASGAYSKFLTSTRSAPCSP